MKKILFTLPLLFAMLLAVSCNNEGTKTSFLTFEHFYSTRTYDSCEYVRYRCGNFFGLAHKGNCRFCEERRKKEIKETVDKLFMMQE